MYCALMEPPIARTSNVSKGSDTDTLVVRSDVIVDSAVVASAVVASAVVVISVASVVDVVAADSVSDVYQSIFVVSPVALSPTVDVAVLAETWTVAVFVVSTV